MSNVVADAGPETFVPGVEVIYWNGTPIQAIVLQNAEKQAGSNGGGLIHAAEFLLQVLTPKRIESEPAQLINTPVNLRLCKAFQTLSNRLPGFSLGE